MKHQIYKLLIICVLYLMSACTVSAPASSKAPSDTARTRSTQPPAPDDLSRYRPVFAPPKTTPGSVPAAAKAAVVPASSVNSQIEQRLRDQAFTNQNVKYAQGYRILAYVGLEREQAMATRRAIISRYPDETDYITFKQPVFRLWIGDYLTRLEAEQAMLRIRPIAPKAELQPAQVVLNKTAF